MRRNSRDFDYSMTAEAGERIYLPQRLQEVLERYLDNTGIEIEVPEQLPSSIRNDLKASLYALTNTTEYFENIALLISHRLIKFTKDSIELAIKSLLLEIEIERRIEDGEDPEAVFKEYDVNRREIAFYMYGGVHLSPHYRKEERGIIIAPISEKEL